jgi:hypothetical protein
VRITIQLSRLFATPSECNIWSCAGIGKMQDYNCFDEVPTALSLDYQTVVQGKVSIHELLRILGVITKPDTHQKASLPVTMTAQHC